MRKAKYSMLSCSCVHVTICTLQGGMELITLLVLCDLIKEFVNKIKIKKNFVMQNKKENINLGR